MITYKKNVKLLAIILRLLMLIKSEKNLKKYLEHCCK